MLTFFKEVRKKSENHVNSKKTHSEGVYYITILGKSSCDNMKESTQRESTHFASCTLLFSLLLGLAELQYFRFPEFHPVQLQASIY